MEIKYFGICKFFSTNTKNKKNPTLRSQAHLQATQTNHKTKACKRACLPRPKKNLNIRSNISVDRKFAPYSL